MKNKIFKQTVEEFVECFVDTVTRVNSKSDVIMDGILDDFCHSVTGIVNEAGELNDIMKSKLWYKEPHPVPHIIEEYGDLMWYLMLGIKAISDLSGISPTDVFQYVLATNRVKLIGCRYKKGKYSKGDALSRDKEAEKHEMMKVLPEQLDILL